MKLVPITDIFDIRYGNQFDISKMDILEYSAEWINFISRTSENNGSVQTVDMYSDIEPFEPWLITVTLGWSYLLASFIQPKQFYTGQNVKVLKSKFPLTEQEKLFYCTCIEANRFRYSSHSREANSTFNKISVPSLEDIPVNVKKYNLDAKFIKKPLSDQKTTLDIQSWKCFNVEDIFDVISSKDDNLVDAEKGDVPYISSSEANNGLHSCIDADPSQKENTITVARIGSVGATFYHGYKYLVSSDNVRVFIPKTIITKYSWIFLATLIEKEKYRYAYGRTFSTARMKSTKIKLPINSSGSPDWQWMEEYIKSLPYSASL